MYSVLWRSSTPLVTIAEPPRLCLAYEATLDKNVVSVKSPIGKELIGKKTHDIVDIETPNGEISYEILSFSFRN